jgi:exodeoxyribonuclease-3
MKIATLNINSVNARLPQLCVWLKQNQPDVMLLQEIKTEFNNFPFFELQMAGFEAKILGQKSYNGVAVLSSHKMVVTAENLPNFADENARYLEVEVDIRGKKYTVASIYLPNGNPPANQPQDTSKLKYKLAWMDAFLEHTDKLLKSGKNVLLGGDFNVILTPQDVYNPELFAGNALYRQEVWARLRQLMFLGYADVFRTLYPTQNGYTFWDYTGGALQNDLGMRIDYIFSAPALTDKLIGCRIDKDFRKQEKASDHTILMAEFED